jgi:hypothetical protein
MSTNTTAPADGSNTLFRDSKLGNLANSVLAGAVTALIGTISEWDWSSGPAWLATLGAPAAGLVVGWLTSWKARRFPARSAAR